MFLQILCAQEPRNLFRGVLGVLDKMRKKLIKHKYRILLILFGISLISSLILSLDNITGFCTIDKGCGVVQNSSYSYTFGVKNSVLGVAIFIFLMLLTVMQFYFPTKEKKLMIEVSVILGSFIALYFILLQQFILRSYCKYCMIADISLLLAFFLILISWKKS